MGIENEKSSESGLEKFLLGSVIFLLIAQTVFSILNFRGIQRLSALLLNSGSSHQDEFMELEDKPYIEFSLPDYNGNDISLSKLIGKPLLIVFTSHTCQACQALYKELENFSNENKGISVILVSSDSVDENRVFLNSHPSLSKLNWVVLSGTRQTFSDYMVSGTPTLVFIDETGIIKNVGYASSKSQIVELINSKQ